MTRLLLLKSQKHGLSMNSMISDNGGAFESDEGEEEDFGVEGFGYTSY